MWTSSEIYNDDYIQRYGLNLDGFRDLLGWLYATSSNGYMKAGPNGG